MHVGGARECEVTFVHTCIWCYKQAACVSVVWAGKGARYTMVVDWILRSTKNMRVKKQSVNSVFIFKWRKQLQLSTAAWFTLSLKMLSFDIRFHGVYPKVRLKVRIGP